MHCRKVLPLYSPKVKSKREPGKNHVKYEANETVFEVVHDSHACMNTWVFDLLCRKVLPLVQKLWVKAYLERNM